MLCFSTSQHSQMSLSVKKADETYGILYSFFDFCTHIPLELKFFLHSFSNCSYIIVSTRKPYYIVVKVRILLKIMFVESKAVLYSRVDVMQNIAYTLAYEQTDVALFVLTK